METKLKKPLPEIKIGYLIEIVKKLGDSNNLVELYIAMPNEASDKGMVYVNPKIGFFWDHSFSETGEAYSYRINKVYGLTEAPGRLLCFDTVGRNLLWEREEISKPNMGEIYYTIELGLDSLFTTLTWVDSEYDNILLERGLVFATEEEAVEFSNKLLKNV